MSTETHKFEIDREHPHYKSQAQLWARYKDLYAGGEQFKAHADRYLVPRNREGRDVYLERLNRVFYENHIGSIIDWYTATLFRREPVLSFEGPERVRRFYGELTEDCDLNGTALTDFFRRQFVEALVCGKSHIVVDFPKRDRAVESRWEEDARGFSRAYLVGYSADDLINWSVDEHGNYEWVVLRTSQLRKKNVQDAEWANETRWIYYDRESYRIYESEARANEREVPVLRAEGTHGFAKLGRVPIFDVAVGDGLWLMNRAALLQLEHFNKSNALAWALTMGLFAMPVVYSDRDFNQIVGESYYIQLSPGDQFGWTEPQGNVFQIAAENLKQLKEEVYRVCYLNQAGGDLSGASAFSAASKQRDFAITQEVLRAYGDAMKASVKRVLRGIVAAREDDVQVDVSGMDEFDIGDFGVELADAKQLLELGVQSPTLVKQVYKKLALKFLCDVRQDIKDQIAREIEGA